MTVTILLIASCPSLCLSTFFILLFSPYLFSSLISLLQPLSNSLSLYLTPLCISFLLSFTYSLSLYLMPSPFVHHRWAWCQPSGPIPPDTQSCWACDLHWCDRTSHCLHGGLCPGTGTAAVQTCILSQSCAEGRVHHMAQKITWKCK